MTNKQLRTLLQSFVGNYYICSHTVFLFVRQAHKLYRRDKLLLSGPAFRYNTKDSTAHFYKNIDYYIDIYNQKLFQLSRQQFLQHLARAIQAKDQVIEAFKNQEPHENPTPVTPLEIQAYYKEHQDLLDKEGQKKVKKLKNL